MKKTPRIIWQFWTGDNEMSPDRKAALATSGNFNVEHRLLTKDDIFQYEVPGHRMHPAYRYLSCNHQSDYLRCYFMRFYGGGYADVKHYSKDNNWKSCFDLLDECAGIDVVGQAEIKGGAAYGKWNIEPFLSKLICTPYFVMRPGCEFTVMWLNSVEAILSSKLDALKKHPATEPRQKNQGDYPLRWLDVMGYPFHELCLSYFNSGRICRGLKSGRIYREYV